MGKKEAIAGAVILAMLPAFVGLAHARSQPSDGSAIGSL